MTERIVIIWCHGGCFSQGSVEYDKELRIYLAEHGYRVIPVDFSLESWELALKDIYDVWKWEVGLGTLIIGGISSGAMMAHEFANQFNLPAVLICPVIKPFDRHHNLPEELKERQLKFFGTLEKMQKIQESIKPPNNARYILYGTKDIRAPYLPLAPWLEIEHVTHDTQDRGHEMCSNLPHEFILNGIKSLVWDLDKIGK